MIKTLILKEIKDIVTTFRFLVINIVCIVTIPLGIYLSLNEYEFQLEEYGNEKQMYHNASENNIIHNFIAQGFRPPSSLSVFTHGLEDNLPYKVLINRDEKKIETRLVFKEFYDVLYGYLDYSFIVSIILPIFVFIFSFSLICGEKEKGTLKLMLSNPIPKWKIIIAKIIGNFISFIIPFIIAFILGIMILNISNTFSISTNNYLSIIFIFLTSIVFLFLLFNLGILISISTYNSATSIVILSLIWMIIVFFIPQISPMIGQIIYPIKSQEFIDSELNMIKYNLNRELIRKEDELLNNIFLKHGIIPTQVSPKNFTNDDIQTVLASFDKDIAYLREEYEKRINNEIKKLENQYEIRKDNQYNLIKNISRFSPVCCYKYMLAELTGTGFSEIDNFNNYADEFQYNVQHDIYDNWIYKRYRIGENVYSYYSQVDKKTLLVPHINNYTHVKLKEVINYILIDMCIIIIVTIIFFIICFVKFIKYDVR